MLNTNVDRPAINLVDLPMLALVSCPAVMVVMRDVVQCPGQQRSERSCVFNSEVQFLPIDNNDHDGVVSLSVEGRDADRIRNWRRGRMGSRRVTARSIAVLNTFDAQIICGHCSHHPFPGSHRR